MPIFDLWDIIKSAVSMYRAPATIEARDAQRMGTLTTSNRRQVASQVYSMLDHLMARKTR